MDSKIKRSLNKLFPQFSSPSKSRFIETFAELSRKSKKIKEVHSMKSKSSSNNCTKNKEKDLNDSLNYDIDINKILKGKDQRTSVIIKGFPSTLTIKEAYLLVKNICKEMNFFYIPVYIREKKKYMYSFVNISNYISLIQLYFGLMKLKNKITFYCNYDFSELSIFYSKTQGLEELRIKCLGKK